MILHLESVDKRYGNAIKGLLLKVKVAGCDNHFLLNGYVMDGGGSRVFTGLWKYLKHHQLCALHYLLKMCGVYNLQLQLSVPIKIYVGEGRVYLHNTIQLLHCVNDIQWYLSMGNNHYAFYCAHKFVWQESIV